MREIIGEPKHIKEVRGGFLDSDKTQYHQHVSRIREGLPLTGQKIVTLKGPFIVERTIDLGRDAKGNWGFIVIGKLVKS